MTYSRRQFLATASVGAATVAYGSSFRKVEAKTHTSALSPDRQWLAALGRSLPDEHDY